IFSGRIVGRQIASDLGVPVTIPEDWPRMAKLLRSRPGATAPLAIEDRSQPVFPIIRCVQEIPCNPCEAACPEGHITLGGSIMNLPRFAGSCLGCGECVSVCPGLAINLVFNDYDPSGKQSLLMLPFELGLEKLPLGGEVATVDMAGKRIGKGKVVAVRSRTEQDRRHLVLVEVPATDKLRVAGFAVRSDCDESLVDSSVPATTADPIVCRCERVRKSAIVAEIRQGVRDMNQLKAMVRATMGACGGKTCGELIRRIFREEGVDLADVSPGTIRPLVAEAPLAAFVRDEGKTDA
ncbi:MAG: (2Fe-2S)-binding protein, partial [Pseudomonadota bacterium]